MESSDVLRLGGVTLSRTDEFEKAQHYLSGSGAYSYPAYDGFDGGTDASHLSDGDLLAPTLLNARPSIKAFYSLQRIRPALESWLAATPVQLRLEDATDRDLKHLGSLFALLDGGLPGVREATLAKVMHRKRPTFVPLYDRFIWRTYVGSPNHPVERATQRRTSEAFIQLLAQAMQQDLIREATWLDGIVGTTHGPAITRLRALDIVGWHAGHTVTSSGDEPLDEDDEDPAT